MKLNSLARSQVVLPLFLALIATACITQPELTNTAHAQTEAKTAPAPSALQEVQDTIDQVVKAAVTYRGDENKKVRRDKLRAIIEPCFDFKEMAQRSLGAQWNNITKEQQDDFVDVFSSLLARTYLERIETVEENMVKIKGETVSFPKAIVKSTVERKGDTFPIDYKLLNKEGKWKVYDVVIENIGLVANYRNEFAGIIRKDKFEGLLQKLKEKSESTK